MGIGTSIFLIAVGAILYFAVNVDISGLEISTIGLILMIVGIVGLVISLFLMSQASRRGVAARPAGRPRARHLLGQAPGPPGGGASSGSSGPGGAPGRSGTCRHSVKRRARMTNATRASSPAAAQARPGALGEAERADDVAPVVLDVEQPRAARQRVVEPAHLLARLQLDRSSTARRSPGGRSSARRDRDRRGGRPRPSAPARGAGARLTLRRPRLARARLRLEAGGSGV